MYKFLIVSRWTDRLRNDTASVPANLWKQAILWGHGGGARRPELAMRWWWQRRQGHYTVSGKKEAAVFFCITLTKVDTVS